jgi:DNA-binding MarR family transcriptional regulator
MAQADEQDIVDWAIDRWAAERPDLNTSSIAVIARLVRLTTLLERRLEDVCRGFGVSLGEFSVLTALRRAGAPNRLTPGRLMQVLMVSSGGVTKRIDALERRGLVARRAHPADGRVVLVCLTPRGRRLVDGTAAHYLAAERALLTPLDDAQRGQLADLLRPLLISLDSASPNLGRTLTDDHARTGYRGHHAPAG